MERGRFENFHKQQEDYVNRQYREATDNTCQWIYQTQEYRNWIKQKQSVLCINGSPGCGKSCLLASMVTNRSSELPRNSLIMKLFYNFGYRPSFSKILQTLLLEALGESAKSSIPVNLNGQVDVSDEDLEGVLFRALIDFGQIMPVFLLIDDIIDLDSGANGSLVPFLGRLLDNASAADILLHVCYSKRDYPPLELPHSRVVIIHQIRVDAYNQPDVRLHVEKEVTKIFSRRGRPPELSLEDQITEMAGASFAVANLYLEYFRNFHPTEKEVNSISGRKPPIEVSLLWEGILHEVSSLDRRRKTRAVAMIQCALVAQRPLSIEEFCDLFNISSHNEIQEMESVLITESLGLLHTSVNKSSHDEPGNQRKFVSFVQPTLRKHLEFPIRTNFLIGEINQTHTEFIAEGHGVFWRKGINCLKACLHDYCENWKKVLPEFVESRLSLDPERNPLFDFGSTLEAYPILEYTLNNLMIHAAQTRGTDGEKRLLAEFHEEGYGVIKASSDTGKDDERYTIFRIWCHLNNCLQGLRIYGPSVTLMHVLAKFNMSDYLSWGIKQGWTYKAKTESHQTALHWAAFYGSEQATKVLLEQSFGDEIALFLEYNTQNKDLHPYHVYHVWSTYVGYRERDYGRAALQIAAAKGNVEIVTLLLSFQNELREKLREELERLDKNDGKGVGNALAIFDSAWDKHLNSNTPTALEHAVEGHHATVVEKLLKHGADWRRQYGRQSPLELAMKLAQDETTLRPATKAIVRMLKAAAFAVLDNSSSLGYKAISYDKLFEATIMDMNDARIDVNISGVTRTQIAIPELLGSVKIHQSDSLLTWYHLPANNMKWAEILILRLFGERIRDELLRHELWTERQVHGSERSYISFMRPGCDRVATNDFVLFMPYIHWETQKKQRGLETLILCKFLLGVDPDRLPSFVRRLSAENNDLLNAYADNDSGASGIAALSQEFQLFLKAVDNSEENILSAQDRLRRAMNDYKSEACVSDRDMGLIDLYAKKSGDKHSLHIRRTLDQSFYHTLDSTFARNKDQVVTRYGRREKRKQPVVMMVDQLWLWCIDRTVITCFPQRRERGLDDPDRYDMTDVLENIVQNISSDVLKAREDSSSFISPTMAARTVLSHIINECVQACFDPMKNLEDDFKFLDMFSNSISRIADGEVTSYERFVKMLKISGQQDLMDIDTESSLLREMKDILDELRMIKLVFIDQLKVIETLPVQQDAVTNLRVADSTVARKSVEMYLDKVISMQEEGERTVNSLNALMDLRQRHATLWEAKSTGRQGNTIMVFTVVTILFLPASFMASFFALPVLQFSRTDSDNMNLTYVVKWIVIFTIPVAAFFVSLAFYINDLLNALSHITGHEGRVAKRLAKAERKQMRHGFISGLDDWKNQDEMEGEYGGSVEQNFQASGQQLFKPVAQLESWLRKRKRRTDSLPR